MELDHIPSKLLSYMKFCTLVNWPFNYLVNKKECNKACDQFQNEDNGQTSHELETNQTNNIILAIGVNKHLKEIPTNQ